jgi:hypothetical protein
VRFAIDHSPGLICALARLAVASSSIEKQESNRIEARPDFPKAKDGTALHIRHLGVK